MNANWGPIFVGILILAYELNLLITGHDSRYWGVPIPVWTGWFFCPAGVLVCVLAIRAILRGEGKPKPPKKYTDEELAQAKAKLDAMYLHEHGELPDKAQVAPADTKDPKDP